MYHRHGSFNGHNSLLADGSVAPMPPTPLLKVLP